MRVCGVNIVATLICLDTGNAEIAECAKAAKIFIVDLIGYFDIVARLGNLALDIY